MAKKEFFKNINFNKNWSEADWEKFFQAQDEYRNTLQSKETKKKPLSRIKFSGKDEVEAFDPVLRTYSLTSFPSGLSGLNNLRSKKFRGDENPEEDYYPATGESPQFWAEGAPLAAVLIYRDCCRFAIFVDKELGIYLKRRGAEYRKKTKAEFESLRFHANWIAINIAEGHQLGYGADRIRGNLAKIRRAIRHAETAIGLISRISLRTQSVRLRYDLFSFAFQLRNALYFWSRELKGEFDSSS